MTKSADDLVEGTFSAAEALGGKRILYVGATGFVGKVALSMLLERFPGIGRVYPLIRPTLGATAADRFFTKVAPSPVFSPLRTRYDAGFDDFLKEHVEPVEGDITEENLGLSPEVMEKLRGKLDAIINVAGIVSFSPPLDLALRINTLGARNVARVAKALDAAVVHVSTCFVAGNRDGAIWEDEEVLGFYPRKEELGHTFSPSTEIADCERICKVVRERAEDSQLQSLYRERAAKRLIEEGRDPNDERALKLAAARERKRWIAEQLTGEGMRRAQHWGWANTYCYTKSLGDQVIAEMGKSDGVRYTIVRPAIVESGLRYPFPGWNEGMTTSAPLAFLSLKGHTSYPAGEGTLLDLIPVDQVAAGLIAATAATVAGVQKEVYQLGSSDSNPLTMRRTVELLGLHRRQYFRQRDTGPKLLREMLARVETIPVSEARWEALSAPAVNRLVTGVSSWLAENRPKWGAPEAASWVDRAQDKLASIKRMTGETTKLFELFMPFIYKRKYVFRCDNIRQLGRMFDAESRALLPWDPENIEWRTYWLDIHMAGLHKWVFPNLEEEFREKPRSVYTHRDLLELFDSASRRFGNKVAMRMLEPDGGESKYSYRQLGQLAGRGARHLAAVGVAPGDKVLLLSENRPEWGIAYFSILKAGAVVVPVDSQLRPEEIANVAKHAGTKRAVVSERYLARCKGLETVGLEALFARPAVDADRELERALPSHTMRADDMASLIFTSGTTGTPKGVMLSHRNFSSLISKLQSVFDMRQTDGLLSVLPLHHTFEFTAGLLMPLAQGAEISYLPELTPDALRDALATGRITSMVGVPAVWQALHRRITTQIADKGPAVERSMEYLRLLASEVRTHYGINLGKVLFWPLHQRFGGRLRLLVSGGSALSPEIMKAFHGLGFSLYEGYGLTEASPVLTVMRPSQKLLAGRVGEPLPGIEVKIFEADASGIGEVIARGPNIMAGYFENPEATSEVIKDGWLHTGDLGKFDEAGQLQIVGRKKEIIIDANGKNVYPDELEEIYGATTFVKELSVVGLPDEQGGETIACLAVPNHDYRIASSGASSSSAQAEGDGAEADKKEGVLSHRALREKIHAHFAEVSSRLPFFKRVKVLHLFEGELPRTATRKVKRRLVAEEIARMERAAKVATQAKGAAKGRSGGQGEAHWVLEVIAQVANKPVTAVTLDARFADLGYDSLMYTELAAALESAGVDLPEDITGVVAVKDLVRLLGSAGPASASTAVAMRPSSTPAVATEGASDEPKELPEDLQVMARTLLRAGQKWAYDHLFDTKIHGQANIPAQENFLVAANHASHLDLGLVKHALGARGDSVLALAAKDYFFDHPVRGFYFKNFTNVLPMERQGSVKESLRLASQALRQGFGLLIFPEGTRSTTGEISEFKASIGYLALSNRVGVLPMYLEGTHEALPKGAWWPKQRDIAVHIGPFMSYDDLRRRTANLPKSESYRAIAAAVEACVRAMKDGRSVSVDDAFAAAGHPAVEVGAAEEKSTAQAKAKGQSRRRGVGHGKAVP